MVVLTHLLCRVHSNDGDLKIGVTPLSGNPQLVVSTQHGRPTCRFGAGNVRTCVNYTWASTTAGVDVVTVPANQYTADSTFYIGVFGCVVLCVRLCVQQTHTPHWLLWPLAISQRDGRSVLHFGMG